MYVSLTKNQLKNYYEKVFTIIFFIGFYLVVHAQLIDTDTPQNTLPIYSQINSNWVLHFSDEFNQDSLNLNKMRDWKKQKILILLVLFVLNVRERMSWSGIS